VVERPGPSHWTVGVSNTPVGRVTVQVRVREEPAMAEPEAATVTVGAGGETEKTTEAYG